MKIEIETVQCLVFFYFTLYVTSGYSISLIRDLQEGGDFKPLTLSPSSLYSSWKGTRKNPWHCSKRVEDIVPDVIVYLTCAVIGLGGRGVIKTWTEVAATVRLYLHADVRSHFSGSYAIQPLAASEKSWHHLFIFFVLFFLTSRLYDLRVSWTSAFKQFFLQRL